MVFLLGINRILMFFAWSNKYIVFAPSQSLLDLECQWDPFPEAKLRCHLTHDRAIMSENQLYVLHVTKLEKLH